MHLFAFAQPKASEYTSRLVHIAHELNDICMTAIYTMGAEVQRSVQVAAVASVFFSFFSISVLTIVQHGP